MSLNPPASVTIGQSAADYLRQILVKQGNPTQIALEFKAITDLLPIVHLLAAFKMLKKLSLHGNRLRQLPTDLSKLSKIQSLDLSNNFLDDNVELTIMSLKTLPHLKNLILPVPPQYQRKVVEQLKSLQYFNNIKVQRRAAKKEFVFNFLNKKTLDEIEKKLRASYQKLIELQQKYLDGQTESDALQKFNQDIGAISQQYLDKMSKSKNQAPPQSLEQIMLLIAKHQMSDLVFSRALNLCEDIYSDLGAFMLQLWNDELQIFKELSKRSLNLTKLEYDLKEQVETQKKLSEEGGDFAVLNKNITLQKEIKRLRKIKDELTLELNQSETQNKKLIDALMKFAKGDKSILSTFNGFQFKENKFLKNQQEFLLQQGNLTNRSIPLPNLRSNEKASSANQKSNTLIMKDSQHYQSNASTGNRNLTLKQLKQTIQQIYESKLRFDQKNFDGKIARQTMHQYLFTYLNQKYGLKNLTIQAAGSIVSGIQAYSSEDNDICVFGKILRNQIDEQFRFVQTELKTTVNDLLKMHIKTKMPYKSASEINQILHEKISHQIVWEQAEDIVKYLYNKHDSDLILKKLDILFKINEKPRQNTNRRITRQEQAVLMSQKQVRKLKFYLFLKCVLDFQLKNHEKLLKPLVRSFKSKDFDNDGIINEQEFIGIIQQLCIEGNEIVPYLLNIVDPYQIKQITFTQMVRLVANYPQSSPILSRFIGDEEDADKNHNDEENFQKKY